MQAFRLLPLVLRGSVLLLSAAVIFIITVFIVVVGDRK